MVSKIKGNFADQKIAIRNQQVINVFLPARLVTTAPTRRINKICPQANQLQGSCYHDHMCGGLATLVPKANVTRFFC